MASSSKSLAECLEGSKVACILRMVARRTLSDCGLIARKVDASAGRGRRTVTMSRCVLTVACSALFFGACSFPTYIPEKVTTDGLLAIRPGMTYTEMENLIGPPLCIVEVEDSKLIDEDKVSAASAQDCRRPWAARPVPPRLRNVADLTLSYAEPRGSLFTDPSIYLNLKAGVVRSVYIKKDDFGICCMDGLPTSPFYWIGSRKLLHDLVGR
jgi:hypothetical protein